MNNIKFSVSSYSFISDIRANKVTALECIKRAKDLGFDAIEVLDAVDFAGLSYEEKKEHALKILEESKKQGIEISCLTCDADFLNKDTDEEISRLKGLVDIAEILGVNRMRHDATVGYAYDSDKYCSFDKVLSKLARACKEVSEYAKDKGVVTMIENHGFFCQDSERVEKLYTAIDCDNFALLCDIGNFMCADEDPAQAVTRVAPYAKYVHLKDFILKDYNQPDPGQGSFKTRMGNYLRGTIIGQGNVPVRQCLLALKKANYEGYMSFEFEGLEPCELALSIGLQNIKNYISQI